jgi:signal transduction histidine kinase
LKDKKKRFREKISMKWKVFGYFLIFTIVLLGILWTIQIVYLDTFYKQIKEKELKKAAAYVQEHMESEDLEYILESLSDKYGISILIADEDGNTLYKTEEGDSQIAFGLDTQQFQTYYQEAMAAGGKLDIFFEQGRRKELEEDGRNFSTGGQWQEKMQESSQADQDSLPELPEDSQEPQDLPVKEGDIGLLNKQAISERMVGIRLVDTAAGTRVILLESLLSPVDATVDTLQKQLVYISISMMVLALGLALLLSKSLTKSIIRVNKSAKRLGNGDFTVEFDGRDYREIAELSETLNYAAGDLAQVERLQRELIANVSHDLRTPLTMIIAYAEVMRDIPGENKAENLQVVIEEAQRLTNLVNDMLDVSKLQAGAVKLNKEAFNLTANIERVMERYAKLKEQDGYQIQFYYEETVWVDADAFKLFQVLYNLINNAINYTGSDKRVEVYQIVEQDRVKIEVRDTGEGIAPEDLKNVWERYYKVDKNHKRAVQGTGLGLSIVKNILKLHNAEYGVESQVGQGSCFWFRLPILQQEEE